MLKWARTGYVNCQFAKVIRVDITSEFQQKKKNIIYLLRHIVPTSIRIFFGEIDYLRFNQHMWDKWVDFITSM